MLTDQYTSDPDERLERIVREILGPVEIYQEAPGPEGPWDYKTVQITRKMNTIRIYDVDEHLWKTLSVPDLTLEEYTDDPEAALGAEIEQCNDESLAAL